MQKKFLLAALFLLLTLPTLTNAFVIVNCGNDKPQIANGVCTNCCTIKDFFATLFNIYLFIVYYIASPLAILAFVIGAIFILLSAGNPNFVGKGKEIIKWAIIGFVLVWCSWVIINFIMTTLGYVGTWWAL